MFSYIRQFLKGLASFIGTAIAFIPFFMGTSTYEDFIRAIGVDRKLFHLLCFIIFLAIVILSITTYNRENQKKEKTGMVFSDFHQKMLQTVFELRNKGDYQSEYASVDDFYAKMQVPCCELCEFIATFLKNKYGKNFSVCIKMIDEKSLRRVKQSKRTEDAQVFTLCRAGHKKKERSGSDTQKAATAKQKRFLIDIKSNSDFLTILSANQTQNLEDIDSTVSAQASVFSCRNLLTYDILLRILGRKVRKKIKYENSTAEYWKYYLSTVVVPIRIASEYLTNKYKSPLAGHWQVVGFLCVDYRWPVSKAILDEVVGYMKGFGDSFYELFHEIGIIDRKLVSAEAKRVKKTMTKGGTQIDN